MNLNSNFLLIGLILVSITCIYLLYININRSNETDSIKQNIKVLISQNKKRDEILNYVIDKLDTLNNTVTTNNNGKEHTISNSQLNQEQQHNLEENNNTENDVVTEEQVQLENELYDVQNLYTEDLQKQIINTKEDEIDYNTLLSSVTNNINLGNDIYSDENNNFVRMSSSTENDEENNNMYHNEGINEGVDEGINEGVDEDVDEDVDEGVDEGINEGVETNTDLNNESLQLNEQYIENINNKPLDLEDINLNELDIENEFSELLNNSDDNGFVMEQFDNTSKIPSEIPVDKNVLVTNLNDVVSQEEVSQEEVSQEEVSLEEKLKNILERENISLNPSEIASDDEDLHSLPRNINVLKNKYSADKLKKFAKSLNVKQTGTKKEIAERIITELNEPSQ